MKNQKILYISLSLIVQKNINVLDFYFPIGRAGEKTENFKKMKNEKKH